MKKILALILAVVMLLSLTGCAEVLDILLDIGIGYLETMDPTDGTTVPGRPVVTDPEDPTQKPTEAPTEPPTEAPTQKPTEAPTEPPV